jgi:ferrous iron transport protein B
VHEISLQLKGEYRLSRRAIALLLLSGDKDTHAIVKKLENRKDYLNICNIIDSTAKRYELPLSYVIGLKRQSQADMIANSATRLSPRKQGTVSRVLDYITIWPVTGIPILFLVLYYGLYRFVGGFGAGTAVNFLELKVFHDFINPLG